MGPKAKYCISIVYETQIKEIKRYASGVDDAISTKNVQKVVALKANLQKHLNKIEESYFEYSTLDEFEEEIEYQKLVDSKDLAELALEKIEIYLSDINDQSKLNEKENDKSKDCPIPYGSINLPKYDLPTFSGHFESWLSFKSIFLSSIDSNESLTDIQKLQYLQNSVTSDASRLIRGFAITKENYKNAWETLLNRYDNKRELAFSQCKKIFNLRTVKSTSESIRTMIDICNEVLRNLKTLGLEINQLVELLLVFTLQDKLEDSLKVKWELTLEDTNFPSLNNFLYFLEKQSRSLQSIKITYHTEKSSKISHKTYSLKATVRSGGESCKLCCFPHLLHKCDKFLNMSVDDRWKYVKETKLCFNCLREKHRVNSCKFTTTCRVCQRKHHTTLHSQSNQNPAQQNASSQEQQFCLTGHMNNSNLILLSTAIVKVKNSQGQLVYCRALIDGGSQTSLITESCCKNLNLPLYESRNTILGLDNKVAAVATKRVELEFSPHFSQDIFSVNALIVKNLTCSLPNFSIAEFDLPHIKGLQLADPSFHVSRPVDIILGGDIFYDLIQYGKISGGPNQPSALNSKLGWLLSGRISTAYQNENNSMYLINCHALVDSENLITKFWEVESIPDGGSPSDEDQEVEKFYLEHTKRNSDGRYVVNLPFKSGNLLGDSKVQAKRRFFSLERRFKDNPEFRNQYVKFMREYQALDHMQPIPSAELTKPSSECFYLPHFGVVREQSETTKLRVVFDASAKTESGISLNDILHTGPKLQNELFTILLKFRCHSIALTGDIEKMFRQVQVTKGDIDFQRIFWREKPEDLLQEFQLLTITYGMACSPYLAIRTIQQLASDEVKNFPEACKVALDDFYVDDLLTGASSIEEAKKLVTQVIELMKNGGFTIRKWASNKSSVLESLPPELRSSSRSLQIEEDHVLKILGLIWDAKKDTFRIMINPSTEERLTKRQLLSAIAKIYDPLGFLSPTTIQLKILMQDLWKESISWDDPVTNRISEAWTQFRNQMEHLAEIKIPRYLSQSDATTCIQLVGFCDSSQRAYAAVFYLRTKLVSKGVNVSMITSKTRVAPVKPITLPRLELMAALLLSQLYVTVIESLRKVLQIDEILLFSDSQIVLDWLKSSPSRWKTFVSNRISKIQELTSEASWHHVRSRDNPADCASRGISASKLKAHPLWWSGPQWLNQDYLKFPSIESPPSYKEDIKCEEKSSVTVTNVAISSQGTYLLEIVHKYSSFSHLIRIIAWCKRFIKNCRSSKTTGVLLSAELDDATKTVIRTVQESEFHLEIQHLQKRLPLPRNSNLLPLNCFLDTDGIIKVGGRLRNSNLSPSQKHPILLPKKHHITKLLVLYFHQIHLHGGPQLTLCCIRQKFWIPSGREVVRRILAKCLTCFRLRSECNKQIMGDLPASRFNAGRAFLNVGLDFGGPFITKPNVPRSKIKIKSYIALFICFSSKAVHLEVVSDLSTDAFLAAFRRFLSRRGKPINMYSDNATNFRGAASYLKEQLRLIQSDEVQNFATQESITWHFIPPIAPHFGGLWEAGIKSTKRHLLKIMKSATLNFEELTTLVTQIEACLNSRPLTPLSSDPQDLEPLTPGHFLIGVPITSFPEKAPTASICLKKRWHLLQNLRNQFWNRWHKEYLSCLQQRSKWLRTKRNLKVNDLVLLQEDNLPPMKWSLGRIAQVFPGSDGAIRVVEVRTSKGQFKRPITKCCLLPDDY